MNHGTMVAIGMCTILSGLSALGSPTAADDDPSGVTNCGPVSRVLIPTLEEALPLANEGVMYDPQDSSYAGLFILDNWVTQTALGALEQPPDAGTVDGGTTPVWYVMAGSTTEAVKCENYVETLAPLFQDVYETYVVALEEAREAGDEKAAEAAIESLVAVVEDLRENMPRDDDPDG